MLLLLGFASHAYHIDQRDLFFFLLFHYFCFAATFAVCSNFHPYAIFFGLFESIRNFGFPEHGSSTPNVWMKISILQNYFQYYDGL